LLGLFAQIKAFFLTLVVGMMVGTLLHLYQASLRAAHPKRCCLYLMDFFIWMILILLVFSALLIINRGEMRVYVFIALILGIVLYYYRLSAGLDQPLNRLAQTLVMVNRTMMRFITWPFLASSRWLKAKLGGLRATPADEPDSEEKF